MIIMKKVQSIPAKNAVSKFKLSKAVRNVAVNIHMKNVIVILDAVVNHLPKKNNQVRKIN